MTRAALVVCLVLTASSAAAQEATSITKVTKQSIDRDPGPNMMGTGGTLLVCDYFLNIHRIDGIIVDWWISAECHRESGSGDGDGGGGSPDTDDGGLTGFKDCKGTCESPCAKFTPSCSKCTSQNTCDGCCAVWKDRVLKSDGCKQLCQETTTTMYNACLGNCATDFN